MQGEVVDCMYGRCRVDEVRADDMVKCTPLSWRLAAGQLPVFYLNKESVKPATVRVGDVVKCNYGGVGSVVEVRETGDYVITLANWKLAQGQSPRLYLQRDSFELSSGLEEGGKGVKSAKQLQREQMTFWKESIQRAGEKKNEANEWFKKGDMDKARELYLEALTTCTQNVGNEMDSLPDSLRADIFETMVPCHNNVATCYLKQQGFAEVVSFARNGLMLARHMEARIGQSNVWRKLEARGMTKDKLTKDWIKKSLFLLSRAEMALKEYDEACNHLDTALKLVEGDAAYEKNAAELRALLLEAQKERKKQIKKEQKIWGGAFEKSKKEQEDGEKAAAKDRARTQAAAAAASAAAAAAAAAAQTTKGTNSSGSSGSGGSSPSPTGPGFDASLYSKAYMSKLLKKDEDEDEDEGAGKDPAGGGSSDDEYANWTIGLGVAAAVVAVGGYMLSRWASSSRSK